MTAETAPKHTAKIECLFHYICAHCKKWWSISGGHRRDTVTCPHCSSTLEVSEP